MNKETEFLELRLYTRNDLSDQSLFNYLKSQNTISIDEYSTFLQKHQLTNSLSENIIMFFSKYESGYVRPDKCDTHEPIREKFNESSIENYTRWLSQPGGAFFLKKVRPLKIEGYIENKRFRPIFEDGKILKPKVKEPGYLGEIKLFIDKKVLDLKSDSFLFNLLKDLGQCFNASYGFIATEDEINKQHCIQEKQGSRYEGMNANLYITGIYLINYFGSDYLDLIGKYKFEGLSSLSTLLSIQNDCIFYLKDSDTKIENVIDLLGKEYFFDKEYPSSKAIMPW